MKGIIFREFISMVETEFSVEMADAIIVDSTLQTGGAYTTVGTYPPEEMTEMLAHLSQRSGIAVPDLLRAFGRHLFSRFAVIHADYVSPGQRVFDLLRVLDSHIHAEVRKLYSDAELPTFTCSDAADGSLLLDYRSHRHLADLAEGLLRGCIAHYGEDISVERIDLAAEDGAHTQFILRHAADAHA